MVFSVSVRELAPLFAVLLGLPLTVLAVERLRSSARLWPSAQAFVRRWQRLDFEDTVLVYAAVGVTSILVTRLGARYLLGLSYSEWEAFYLVAFGAYASIFVRWLFRFATGSGVYRGAIAFVWLVLAAILFQLVFGLSMTLTIMLGGLGTTCGALLWIDRLAHIDESLNSLARQVSTAERRVAVAAIHEESRLWLIIVVSVIAVIAAGLLQLYQLVNEFGDDPLAEVVSGSAEADREVAAAAWQLVVGGSYVLLGIGAWIAAPAMANLRRSRSLLAHPLRSRDTKQT